jgi:hypothetical protein
LTAIHRDPARSSNWTIAAAARPGGGEWLALVSASPSSTWSRWRSHASRSAELGDRGGGGRASSSSSPHLELGSRNLRTVNRASEAVRRSSGWYGIIVTTDSDPSLAQQLAGHLETGRNSISAPALGG